MISSKYLFSELTRRGQRTVVNISLVAIVTCVLVCIMLLSDAMERAFYTPLRDIGATMTVQKAGDVPEQMAGPVLPCSVAPISAEKSSKIESLAGVQSISRAILFWDFSDDVFQIVVGFQPEDLAGPALLHTAIASGRMLNAADSSMALAEITWAKQSHLDIGDRAQIGGQYFSIVGLVDVSQISHIGTANLYIPLSEAQKIASKAPSITAVHRFDPDDSNLLFIQADRDKTEEIASAIKELLGEKTTVSTPDSFKKLLGSLFNLTQKFSGMISGIVFIFALLLVMRNSVAAVRDRTKEIGTMKALGWTGADICKQLLAENCLYIVLGTLFGLALGWFATWGLSNITIAIPIPWEMAPKPHFLPGGEEQLFRQVQLQMEFSLQLLIPSCAIPFLLALATAWTAGASITKLKTMEVLRYE